MMKRKKQNKQHWRKHRRKKKPLPYGCGITLDDQPMIFERFYSGRGLNSAGNENSDILISDGNEYSDNEPAGIGLGLYVVKSLADQINGKISAQSPVEETAKGTRFTVLIPVK